MIAQEQLSNDKDELKSIVYQLIGVVEEQKLIIANQNERIEILCKKNEEQAQKIDELSYAVSALKRHRFGKRSEKFEGENATPDSLVDNINDNMDTHTPDNGNGTTDSTTSPDAHVRKKGHGRAPFPKHLPRRPIHYEIKASERMCDCCGSFLSHMGHQVSEQLEIIPAQVYVLQHIRHKYSCRKCQDNVIIAKMPDQPIDKGKVGPGVLAEVLVNKYQDHLPLYRQSQRFSRLGLHLSRSTLCGWVMRSANLLSPLVDAMKKRALIPSNHLFSDDTHIKTLTFGEEKNIQTGRFWVYTNKGAEDYPACTVYQYTETREAAGPISFLKDFKGFLQADAYSGYDQLYKDTKDEEAPIVEVACWAHARRKFYEIEQMSSKKGLAHEALEFIQQLYEVEREAYSHSLDFDGIKKWRNTHAPPILKNFHEWLEEQQKKVLPKSRLAGAIGYALNHWEALNSYLREGYLEIDNNRSERNMKPLAVGRKNYLFVGSITGGEAAAIIYSLLVTCQQHQINPWAYLKDVLTRIPTHPNAKIDELLPYNWKNSVAEEASFEILFNKVA